jgi:hypothetical protein
VCVVVVVVVVVDVVDVRRAAAGELGCERSGIS